MLRRKPDPFVDAGYLAAATTTITLGTAGIVLSLREPISVAKQAASVDRLIDGGATANFVHGPELASPAAVPVR